MKNSAQATNRLYYEEVAYLQLQQQPYNDKVCVHRYSLVSSDEQLREIWEGRDLSSVTSLVSDPVIDSGWWEKRHKRDVKE